MFLKCLIIFLLSISIYPKQFVIDKTHSYVGFKVKYMMVSNVRGNFLDFSGTIDMDKSAISSIKSTIVVETISTNNKKRDAHLRSDDFFNVELYPNIVFKSKKVIQDEDVQLVLGALTMHGITKHVSIPFTQTDIYTNPDGIQRFGVEASLKINRKDYGILYSKTMDNGGLVVDDYVTIILNVQYVSNG